MKLPLTVLVQVSQVGTLVLGCLGIWVAMLNQRRQLNAQMFIEVSRRFQELLRLFPTDAWLANRNPAQPLPPRSREITDCTLYCFQLIADVHHLRQRRFISDKVWTGWEREIKHVVTGRIFQREWSALEIEFAHNQDFMRYINVLMDRKQRTRAAAAPCDPLIGES